MKKPPSIARGRDHYFEGLRNVSRSPSRLHEEFNPYLEAPELTLNRGRPRERAVRSPLALGREKSRYACQEALVIEARETAVAWTPSPTLSQRCDTHVRAAWVGRHTA